MGFSQAAFYGILDTGYVSDGEWEAKCEALIRGGAGVIQLRAKKESQDQRRALLERILPLFMGIHTPLIINDDIELVLQYPDLGLHVGQDDIAVTEARQRLGPQRYLGLSTHSPRQADAAMELADMLSYFAVGPVFSTQTKPDYIPVGLELVRYVARKKPTLPWFCIGGISRSNVQRVRDAGARGVVAVSDALCARDTAAAVREFASIG